MKKNILFSLFAIPFLLNGQIVSQGFEGSVNDTWDYSLNVPVYNNNSGTDLWTPYTASLGSSSITARTDATYFAGRDLDNPYSEGVTGDTTPDHFMDFNNVFIAQQACELSIWFNFYGYDSSDYIYFEVLYNTNMDWSSPDAHVDVVPAPSASNVNSAGNTWEEFTHSIPAGIDSVRVRIAAHQNGASDYLGIDDVSLSYSAAPPASGPSISITASTNPTCNGASTGSITATVTDGTANYDYVWSNGASTLNTASLTNTISSLSAGYYKVVVTDDNGLKDSTDITLTQPTAVVASTVVDSNLTCNGALDGGATASATGGTPPYSYMWSNSATTASITGVAAGTYNVTITDANGCTDNTSVTITEPAVLVASAIVDSNVSCNGFLDGGATASATGGDNSSYYYEWSNGATTASITGVAAGTYKVYISDHNECLDSATVTITQPAAMSASVVIDSNASCNGFSDGGATASASGGTPPYSYSWNNTATTASITGVTAGTYTVTITDANGCTASNSGTITQPIAVVASAVVDSNASCNGFSDGGASASATGGTPPYSYSWSNTATTASITGVVAGTYNVTITDANGCSGSTSVTITQPAAFTALVGIDSNVTCNGFSDGGATASASGGTPPYSYSWNNTATTASITGVTAGTYTVTITDASGCTASNSGTITQPAAVAPVAVVDSNVSCNGFSDGGASAAASGGTPPYTYSWSNGATTASITGVVAGTYTVWVTDANGCYDTTSVVITQPVALMPAAVVDSNVSCNGFSDGGASAAAAGGTMPYTYLWSNGATTASITGVVAGTYTVWVTDANGCYDTTSVTITQPVALMPAAVVDSNVSCNGFSDGGASAAATGGTMPYTYLWSNGATTASITGVVAGTYTVWVTDANGCYDTTSVTITEPAALMAAAVVDSNITCNGFSDGGATAAATGGTMPYTYLWSNGATTASITGVVAGTYNVTITDANGCYDTTSVTITEPATLMAATVVDSNVSCNGLSDGGATASATGGTMPYTYLWSNSATTASITGVVAGTYTVTITDANGCYDTTSVTITEAAVLVPAAVVDSNVSCNGLSDGGATVSATGGTMPYTYLWSNGATTASITGVPAGTYIAWVTDANGCYDTTSVTITEPAVLVAATVVDSNVSCNGLSDGGASASATGGTMPYTYLWSNGATTASITGVTAGSYTVWITDANGCYDTTSVTITEPAALIAAAVVDSNVSCYGLSNGGATASATGGTMPYTYVWSNGATTASITGVVAGSYTVWITDANGCYDTTSVTITEPAFSGSTDTVKAIDSYEWIDGNTYTATTYGPTHTLTNINGCDSVITLDLTIINYCASRSTRNRFEWIKQVELEDDIDNLSGKNSGGYGDYTDQLLTVDTGDVVSVTLTPGYKRRKYVEYWRIWADWNYDGDFNDPGEMVFQTYGKNVRTGSFTVPVDVDAHELGLRVSMRWRRYAPSCGNFSSGEVEDYRIKVNGAQGYSNPIPVRLTQDDVELADEDIYEFIELYPNPVAQGDIVTGFVRVESLGEKQLMVVNTLGQVIKTESIICDEEESRFEISTEGLAKGIYFINIESGIETTKIIVK